MEFDISVSGLNEERKGRWVIFPSWGPGEQSDVRLRQLSEGKLCNRLKYLNNERSHDTRAKISSSTDYVNTAHVMTHQNKY